MCDVVCDETSNKQGPPKCDLNLSFFNSFNLKQFFNLQHFHRTIHPSCVIIHKNLHSNAQLYQH